MYLACPKNLTRLNERLWLKKTIIDPSFSFLHPWFKCLNASLELSKVLDVFTEPGSLSLDVAVQDVQLRPHSVQSFHKPEDQS